MYLEMFSDLDLVRTIDDNDEVPEDPDSASDDEAVSSLYSPETLTNSRSVTIFSLWPVLFCYIALF